VKSLDEGR
jgi:hypothetical protein